MSRINHVILPQNYEFVRDRIANILLDEMTNQLSLTGDYDIDVDVFVERTSDFDETELPVINVSIDAGSWANKHQGSSTGTYVFNIDTIASAKSKGLLAGDTLSSVKGQRIAGLIRSILEDPQYKTLGFTPPFISRTWCQDMKFGTAGAKDANNQMTTRISFYVMVNETTDLLVPNLIEGYDTTVKIDNTSQGYFYQGENY